MDSQGLNNEIEIRAGLFKSVNLTITPPSSDPRLRAEFLSHLTPETKLSPFISVFESFLPALHRALKNGKQANIAVIDLQLVRKDLRKRFPDAATLIWPVGLHKYFISSSLTCVI